MTALANRVISIFNRRTSIRFAPAEWAAIDYICNKENISRKNLFELIDFNRDEKTPLASSIRLFIIVYYKNAFLCNPRPAHISDDDFYSPIFEAIKGII